MFIIGMFILTQIKKGWDIELKNYINTQNFYNDENYSLTQKKHWVRFVTFDWLVKTKCQKISTNNFNLQKG